MIVAQCTLKITKNSLWGPKVELIRPHILDHNLEAIVVKLRGYRRGGQYWHFPRENRPYLSKAEDALVFRSTFEITISATLLNCKHSCLSCQLSKRVEQDKICVHHK